MYLTGRFPLLLLCGLTPVVLWPHAGTVLGWTLLCLLTAGIDVVGATDPSRLQVRRAEVRPVRAGERARSVLGLSNPTAHRLEVRVRDAWQPSVGAHLDRHRVRLAAGGQARVVTELTPLRRGDLSAQGVTLRCAGPFAVAGRQRTIQVPGLLRALPAFPSRRELPSRLARLRELDGRSAVRVRGQGTEFDSLREYVRGDDVRSIDWRASARSRHVVVRTWQPERDRRIVLVLDTSRVAAGRVHDSPRLDTALDAALLLTALAGRAGDRIDVVAGDRAIRTRLRLAGPGAVAQLQEAMVRLTPEITEADWSRLAGAVQELGRQRALVVLLTPLEPAPVIEGLLPVLPALARQHRVVLASVTDPELEELTHGFVDTASIDRVHLAAAAEQALAERGRVVAMLRSLGVETIRGTPESLAPALADHYLMLKANGLL